MQPATEELTDTIARWQQRGVRLALATVIKVDGSAPRDEGAKMVVAEDGRIAGSVSGGCVEAAVAEEAMAVLASGTPTIARYGIDRKMMWDVGLSCGGAIDVFIEPLALTPPSSGTVTAVCTVVRGPQSVGRKLTVSADGATRGDLGSAALDAAVAAQTPALIKAGRSVLLHEGSYEVFVDVTLPKPRALIVGAVHIAVALAKMAAQAGFDVTVIDPRPALCNKERFPDAARLDVRWPDEALADVTLDENTYIAVLTHDEKFDDPTLRRALPSHAHYVGAIGSRKTQGLRRERLLEAGMPDDVVARLHGPIGLDIGAQSPEEIAVAILAEMIAAKYQRDGLPLRGREAPRIHA
ncbi:MAG: XdhC family protein [Candidatus Eremiobacteraeota bacterium]|nr:XdhC family protein [Candidatus Eremiobacteraeota bacterium]